VAHSIACCGEVQVWQDRLAQLAGSDGRRVGHATAVDQVVARAGDVADHPDSRLACAAGIAAAHPGHAVVAAARLGLLDRRHGVRARHRIAQRHAFGHLAPAKLAARHVGHLLGHGAARQLGAVEIQPRLQHAIGEQVVQAGIGALDDQRRQRCHGARGALDHVAHDLLETVGDAVELVAQRGLDAHVAADQVAVPAHADADRAHAGRAAHGHRAAAADRIHHLVADDGAAGSGIRPAPMPGRSPGRARRPAPSDAAGGTPWWRDSSVQDASSWYPQRKSTLPRNTWPRRSQHA
jgi:hypothetical protein